MERIFRERISDIINNIKGYVCGYSSKTNNTMIINDNGKLFRITIEYLEDKKIIDFDDIEKYK